MASSTPQEPEKKPATQQKIIIIWGYLKEGWQILVALNRRYSLFSLKPFQGLSKILPPDSKDSLSPRVEEQAPSTPLKKKTSTKRKKETKLSTSPSNPMEESLKQDEKQDQQKNVLLNRKFLYDTILNKGKKRGGWLLLLPFLIYVAVSFRKDPPPEKLLDTKVSVDAKTKQSTPASVDAKTQEPSPVSVQPSLKDEPDISTPVSRQPLLNLSKVKGIMRTINPHFFMDVPLKTHSQDIEKNRCSIIIFNMGEDETLTDELLGEIPEEIAFSVTPYASDFEYLVQDLKVLGHRTLLQMSWEDGDPYSNQGFLGLSLEHSKDQLIVRLRELLNRSQGTQGFFVYGGGQLLRYVEPLKTILQFIVANKNVLISPPDVLMTKLHELAAPMKLNYASVTLIDPPMKQVHTVGRLIKRTGFAILAFQLKKSTKEDIKNWIQALKKDKIELVPLDDILPLDIK